MAFLKKAKDPFKEIQSCLQKRDYKGALAWFDPLLKKETKNTQIRLRFADTLVLAGSKKEAIRQYRIVADELAEAGFMIRAIAINKKIVQLDPSQTDVHAKLAAMNEERSRSTASWTALPLETPAPPFSMGPPATETRGPTLTLEESMALEFGNSVEEAPEERPFVEQPPAASGLEAEEDELVEIDVEPVDLAVEDRTFQIEESSVGFDLVDKPERPEEKAASPEASEEVPSFTEEPVVLEEELDVDMEEEIGIETEPEMAADGENPLVGLLGEDIDALVDSIIDDVASSGSGAPPSSAPRATRIPLFSDLTAGEFVDVAIMLVRRAEKAGTVIVKEGEPGESMFIVSTGEVEATRREAERQLKLATFRDGDFFGEMAVLSGEPRTATVTAVRNTELLELSRKDLQLICSRHPEVEAKLRLAYDERRTRGSP